MSIGLRDPRITSTFTTFDLTCEGLILGSGYFGSKSHNTYVPPTDPESIDDLDIFGVVLPPPRLVIGLNGWEHAQIQRDELDVVMYSFQKFVRLLLKANPNVLGWLWLRDEDYLTRTPVWDRLVAERDIFTSQRAGATFAGYANSQLQKMTSGKHLGYMGEKRKKLVERFGYDCKNASHLIRLLAMGSEFMQTGQLAVYRTDDADLLRDIKRGMFTLEEVQQMAAHKFEEFNESRKNSPLPPEPDQHAADVLVIEMTRDWLIQGR
jgi:predicted nucleotidyltransferase